MIDDNDFSYFAFALFFILCFFVAVNLKSEKVGLSNFEQNNAWNDVLLWGDI